MSSGHVAYSADEFERESAYLETIVWEAMMVEPGAKVLFCGFGPDGAQVRHAIASGADVTVIEHRDTAINRFASLGARLLRGSTSVIPAKENAFDLAVSFHYLHEVDPFFHAQILSELARVARRIAIVEPAPPGDALGKRIALLYSQAKRELGQFEYYQPLEYWKKLLQAVKAEVTQHVFAFGKVPPREYLVDTIELLLRTMEVEEAPAAYIEELRAIARRSDAQLLPPPRYVLVGAALGELPVPQFTDRGRFMLESAQAQVTMEKAPPAPPPVPPVQAPAAGAPAERTVSTDAGYEFPPVEPPAAAAAAPPSFAPPQQPPPEALEPPPAFVPGLPFGAPPPPQPAAPPPPAAAPAPSQAPFGAPFAIPGTDPFGAPPAGIPPSSTWQWEPPEGETEGGETPFGQPEP